MSGTSLSRRAIKEEIIAINRDWVYNQVCRLSHDQAIFIMFDYPFEMITKRLSNNCFEFTNK